MAGSILVTKEHEAPIELFRKNPNLLPLVLRQLGIDIEVPSAATVEFTSERCTDNKPAELVADEVPLLKVNGVPVLAVVFEVQREHVRTKFGVWPRYVAAVWDRYRVPTVLLVYCEKTSEAHKLIDPIHMGPGNVITAHAISPATLPPIMNIDDYGDRVELAVFAALMHAGGPYGEKTLENLSALLATIGQEQAQQYAGCLIGILPESAATFMEELMDTQTYAYQDGFARFEARGRAEGKAEGKAEGEAKMLMRMLEMRGFEVTPQVRDRVMSCGDTAQLEAWADRIPQADTIEKVFE